MKISETSTEENTEIQLTFFQVASRAKIPPLQTSLARQMGRKASRAKDHPFGMNMRVWLGKLDLEQLCLKTAQCCLIEDLNKSYLTWPSSGMMLNGDCFMLPSSDFRTSEKGFLELPTPAASDGKVLLKKAESYKEYYLKGHQDKPLYQFQLNGLTADQAMRMYEWMMGFPENWTKLESMAAETL